MPMIRLIFILATVLFTVSPPSGETIEKVKGVALVGPPKQVGSEYLDPIKELNADHVCIIPYAYGPNSEHRIYYKGVDWQWWGERKDGVKSMIDAAHAQDIKVMLKPHLWLQHGAFTGHFEAETEEEWQAFEESYEIYIIEFAWLARETEVEIFCIGTELSRFVEQRTEYWKALIRKVRSIYSGKITYAANWDSFDKIPFWKELDLIGIDAYFPLSESKTPEVAELIKGWRPHFEQIQRVQKKNDRPIIFLEYGYRSIDHAAKKPWDSGRGNKVANLKAQENAYMALYEMFWDQPWFAGGFLWKWHTDHQRAGGPANTRFTPQNKPAERSIRERYDS